ncbi:MAG: hypothetical protein WDO69_26845 [Pseudomonadota bacterium]
MLLRGYVHPSQTLQFSVVLALAVAACSGAARNAPGPGASGESGGGGGRTTPSASSAGAGGAGGARSPSVETMLPNLCGSGLHVLRAIDAGRAVVWPEQQRVAFTTSTGTIEVDDTSALASSGRLARLAELSNETFNLTSDWSINWPIKYGDGLLLAASDGGNTKIFSWHVDTGSTELLVPLPARSEFISIADPEAGIAFVAGDLIYRAIEDGGVWLVGAPIGVSEQRRTPLAFDGDDLLVGLEESGRLYDGAEAGSGGEGGAAGGWTAKLERWNSAGELIASYPAVGNPRVATPSRGGWLIGETNSFWGSYEAALEWLTSAKDELRTVSKVPVQSAGDGEDGAFGVAVDGDRVFVANCESGLLGGSWQGSSVLLAPLWAPPVKMNGACDPQSVQMLGNLLVIGGAQLTFARLCADE